MKHIATKLISLITLFSLLLASSALANETTEYSAISTGLGTGMLFFEADEEFNSSLIIEGKVGYDLNERYTLETSFGYLPYMDADHKTSNNPNTWHLDESQGFRAATDLLYHLDKDPNRTWDPTLGITGGVMYFSNSLENGQHFNPFGGLGGGLGYALTKNWQIRGDYRTVVAGHDTEINHHALISFNYRWDKGSFGGSGSGSTVSDAGRIGHTDTPGPLRTIYFEFDKSSLTADSQQRLKDNANYLKENSDVSVTLEGHCDERGTEEYNLALGERRAHSAREYLNALGVKSERLETTSYGETRPAVMGHNETAWAKNRRVECIPSE